jgi:hypothetical protein
MDDNEVLEAVKVIRADDQQATVERVVSRLKADRGQVEEKLDALTARGRLYKIIGGSEWPYSPEPAKITLVWYLPTGR